MLPTRQGVDKLSLAHLNAPVAQGIEHPPPKRGAASSILAGRATFFLARRRVSVAVLLRWADHLDSTAQARGIGRIPLDFELGAAGEADHPVESLARVAVNLAGAAEDAAPDHR